MRLLPQFGPFTARSVTRVIGIVTFALLFAAPLAAVDITTTSPLPGGTLGTFYSLQLNASGCLLNQCAWSVTSGTLPAGLNLSSTGVLSGTPTAATSPTFTVRADGGILGFATRAFTLTIAPTLAITTASLPGTTVGAAYSQTLSRTGGTSPFTWSLPTGLLPGGVLLNSSTGVISGTPTASGTFNFTVRVTDSAISAPGASANQAFSIVVASALSITTASLPAGTSGAAYSQTLARSGGTAPFTWSIAAGSLPGGLTLNPGTGTISGPATAAGTFNFTAQVADSVGATTTRPLSITINAAVEITTTSLPSGTQGTAYSTTLARSGGTSPFTWSISTGSLPPPLSLSAGTGAITGNPSTAGTFNFTVLVTDAAGATDSQVLSIVIATPLNITTTSLPGGVLAAAYSVGLNRTGGSAPFTWTIASGSLPAGLGLSASSGTITGTPSATGTSNFTVRVTDALSATDTQALSIKIVSPLAITTTSLPQGTVGTSYTTTLAATGGTTPYTWSVVTGSLPAGLSLNGSSGAISGTPNTAGTENFLVRVTDSDAQTDDQPMSIAVVPALSITTSSPLQPGMVGVAYSQTLTATGGTSPYTWLLTAGALPGGLAVAGSTGAISGTPSAAGTFNFTIRVTDSAGSSPVSKAFSVVIDPFPVVIPPLTISNSGALTPGTLGVQYSQSLNATGGVLPYTWSMVTGTGALPNGLSLTSAGILSGTPTVAGTFSFTVRVTDSSGPPQTATKSLTLTIVSALAILTSSLPPATAGTPYSTTLSPAGGTLPYSWAVTSGSLPSGLTLNSSTGVISGTPTVAISSSVTIRLTDSQQPPPSLTTSKVFTMVVQLPQIDTNIPATLNAAQQLPLTMSLRSPYPTALSGQLTLSFDGNGTLPNDPMVQFSNGQRTVAFTIPANNTAAVFSPPVSLLTGTVAGSITLTASFQGGPPNQQAGAVSAVPLNAPQITTVTATLSGTSMTIRITGYATPRSVTNLTFGFEAKTASGIQRVDLTRSADPDFPNWYQNLQSIPFGSTFVFSQIFSVQSNGAELEAVTVTLTNAQGSSSSNRTLVTRQ